MKITRCKVVAEEVEVPERLEEFKNWKFTSGVATGGDFKVFAKLFRKEIIRQLPEGAKLVKFSANHYCVSGFVKGNGSYVYFSASDVRHFPGEWYRCILIREAKSDSDYTGGCNYYTTLDGFGGKVLYLLNKEGKNG